MIKKQIVFLWFLTTGTFFYSGLLAQDDCMGPARDLYRVGDYSGALAMLKNCDDTDKDVAYAELLASAFFHSGDLKSALQEANGIPDSVAEGSLIALKARIHFARGDYESARGYYLKALEQDSLNAGIIRQLAVCNDKLGFNDISVSYYRRALALNPSDIITGIRLTEKLASMEDLAAADSVSAMLLAADSLPELLRLRGDILYRLKEYPDAWACYEPILRKGSSDPELLRKAGICKFTGGETDLAISLLSTAHLIRPDDELTCYYLGLAYQSKPDYKSSELYFKAAIANGISQNMSNYYQRLGDMYETSGNYAKALESFQNALKYREENDKMRPELHYHLGRIYDVYFEDYKSAIRNYDQFLITSTDTADYKYQGIRNRKEALEKLVK